MLAIMIDPRLQRVTDIELADIDMLLDMKRLIGCESLGHSRLSDAHDHIWCDDTILARGQPCFGFRLGPKDKSVILAGRCIIIGSTRWGETRPPQIPIEMIVNDCVWLGEIVPSVDWVEQPGIRINGKPVMKTTAIVTYSRVGKA